MSQAVCFNCGEIVERVDKPMEELIRERFPIFCTMLCSREFPDNGTIEFERKFEELEKRYEVKPNS